jgi:hypothetical protein
MCGEPIPESRDARAFYCSQLCGQRAWRRRNGTKPFVPAVVDGKKRCNTCGVWKPIEDYTPRKQRKGAPISDCRPCMAERCRNYNRTPEGRSVKHARKYGVPLGWYEETLAAQGGACAICLRPSEKLHVDHCHASGQVRGLLCFECNTGLGKFADNIASLERAIEYLKR